MVFFPYFISDSPGGLVFGIPLSQCLENDRIARIAAGEVSDVGCLSRSSRHGSRTSFTSLIEPTVAAKTDEVSEVVEHSRQRTNMLLWRIYFCVLIGVTHVTIEAHWDLFD